jgi:Protein of unknown function (DUF2809)
MNIKRNRFISFFLLIIVMCSGLMTRKIPDIFPEIVNTYLGDALWALMVFVLLGLLFKDWSTKKIGIAGLSFCYLIEISQFYHAGWIDAIRSTTLGGLVLGFGFLWSDIVAYTIGISFGIVMEWGIRKFQLK